MGKDKFNLRSDDKFNPELKQEIQDLRGLLFSSMPDLNPRFELSKCIDRPACIILDTQTGKMSSPIGLCHLRGAIQVLNELF